MSKVLYVGSHGAENPVRATLPFLAALIAFETDEEATLLLRANAASLVRATVAKRIRADEWPALADLFRRVVAYEIPVYV